ncbi:MAG: DUF4476 domain-containing protein [Bacteroidetes bacterium]|nr:DUF4476 domain-containing protein [Bacteroidota bacterium]
MKYWTLFLLMVLGSTRALPQQAYFMYLQTDDRLPFYIRMGEKVYSSTASGYLIIPRLSDTTYQLIAGFPGNVFPEQYFSVDMHHKDGGYLLKNFGDKGWGLFNLQSLAVIMNSNASLEKKSPEVSGTRKTDAFSALLANAVNDTSILYVTRLEEPAKANPVVKNAMQTSPVTEAPVTNTIVDSSTTAKTSSPPPDTPALPQPSSTAKTTAATTTTADTLPKNTSTTGNLPHDSATVAYTPPIIRKDTAGVVTDKLNTIKVAELLTDTSYIAVYTDGTSEKFDTIRVSIPLDKPGVLIQEAPRSNRQPVYNMPGETAAADSTSAETGKKTNTAVQQKPVIVKDTALAKDTAVTIVKKQTDPVPQELRLPTEEQPKTTAPAKDSVAPPAVANNTGTKPAQPDSAAKTVSTKIPIPNSDCRNLAWDSDIDKLRIKMMAAKSDDEKILLAKKLFKQKCMTVKQVKALSELFTSDEGRYKWFDASYPSVTDTANFSSLGELIKDEYYQSRFKAMVRH